MTEYTASMSMDGMRSACFLSGSTIERGSFRIELETESGELYFIDPEHIKTIISSLRDGLESSYNHTRVSEHKVLENELVNNEVCRGCSRLTDAETIQLVKNSREIVYLHTTCADKIASELEDLFENNPGVFTASTI